MQHAQVSIAIKAIPKTFQVEHLISSGTYGHVFKVRRLTDGKHFAAKVVCGNYGAMGLSTTARETEADILKSLQRACPNIIELHGHIVNGQFQILVMEYCSRGTLIDAIAYGEANNDEFSELDMLQDVLCGLKYMHNQGVAHGDIKPDNILIGDDNNMKIADFGMSIRQTDQNTAALGRIGTPFYTAPEVKEYVPYDPFKADMWSVGVMFFAMLFKKLPFSEALMTIRNSVITKEDVRMVLEPLRYGTVSITCLLLLEGLLDVDARTRLSASLAHKLCARELRVLSA